MAVRSLILGAVGALLIALAGCGGDDGGDQASFCDQLQENLTAVMTPAITSGDGADEHLALLRDLGASAPLALEEDWGAYVLAHELADAVEPGDDESQQRAAAAAYAMERSGIAIAGWVQSNCGFQMGPLVTVSNVAPPTTTTVPGETSVAVDAPTTTTTSP